MKAASLEALEREGRLPAVVPGAWTCPDAARLALQLPRAVGDAARPSGWGLYPPRGAEPMLRLRSRTMAADGHVVAAGAVGVLGVLWRGRRDDSPVHRLHFQSHGSSMRWIDCYDDQIAGLVGLGDAPPPLTGWSVGRL